MKYNSDKNYFSFPLFRRFMWRWYNYECYLHDVDYRAGGSEIKRWFKDLTFCWRVIKADRPFTVRVGGSVIAVAAAPVLLLCGWYRWYRVRL